MQYILFLEITGEKADIFLNPIVPNIINVIKYLIC